MAHGWVSAEIDKQGNNIIEFLRYERLGDGQFQLVRGSIDVVRLRKAAEDITQYCENVLRLFRRIYAEKNLKTKRRSGTRRKSPPRRALSCRGKRRSNSITI